MNILIIGSGGREHALAWKLALSPLCDTLFIAPGNAGTLSVGTNLGISPSDHPGIASAVRDLKIDMLVIGPEQPLADGMVDYFRSQPEFSQLMIIGPGRQGAMLESSKDFAKSFMERHGIPTAAYRTFSAATLDEGLAYLGTIKGPYVLKADGLAAGKGVIITPDLADARKVLREMLSGMFGSASAHVVVEEFLDGIELSVFILTDGLSYCILPEAKDYKRIGDGDQGPNTGGMGSVSPVPFADEDFLKKVEERILKPTVSGLASDGIPYVGFIFAGLMNVGGDPYVIEYNVRLGDPETQSVLPRIGSDLLELLTAAAKGNLDSHKINILPDHALTVVLASGGYPDKYEKGKLISGLDQVRQAMAFHAGTAMDDEGNVLTAGGRVLAVTALAATREEAGSLAYRNADSILFENKYMRRDIGLDLDTY